MYYFQGLPIHTLNDRENEYEDIEWKYFSLWVALYAPYIEAVNLEKWVHTKIKCQFCQMEENEKEWNVLYYGFNY